MIRALNAARELRDRRHDGGAGDVMRILMIDNYDSFTYNLVQYLGELGADVTVKRNDAIDIAGVRALHPDAIVVSPGPCTPKEAGISLRDFARTRGRAADSRRMPRRAMHR
jgi:carbamoylphosphate synthase small subunit